VTKQICLEYVYKFSNPYRIPMDYYLKKQVSLSYEDAIKEIKDLLAKEGFGILTTIDVKETLKNKLNVDFDKYIILGACNPKFSHEALLAQRDIGVLLPCNVLVYEEKNKVYISTLNPLVAMSVADNDEIKRIALEVEKKLQIVLNNIN
jgi:uncharacterized protein (DUF302 family)